MQPSEELKMVSSQPHALTQTTSYLSTTSVRTEHRGMLSGYRLKVIVFSLCLAQFLSALDITIVATALPTIAGELGATAAEYTWVSSSYTLASTASTPLWSKCSDLWGRKPVLMTANAIFMAGSLIAGLSKSVAMLIGGRTLQGLGGGGILIICQIIIADIFNIQARAKYYGLSALVWAVSSGMGPILGGVFTQTIGWQWCFFINLPLDAISLVLLFFTLKLKVETMSIIQGLKAFDWIGSIAIVGGTICFLCGLEAGAGGQHGWVSGMTLGLMLSGIALIVLFVIYEWKFAKLPLVPMRVFAGRSKVAALATGFFHSFVFISYDFFLPLYFQTVLGASPIHSGLYLLTLIVPLSCLAAGSGIFIKKTGKYRLAIWVGSVVMTFGTGLFINFGTKIVWWKLITYQLVTGIGAGPVFIAPMVALQNHLAPEDVSPGTSAFTFLRSISTSISIVTGGVVLQRGIQSGSFTNLSSHGSDNAGGPDSPLSNSRAQEYTSALSNLWIFYTAVCGLMLISGLLIGKTSSNRTSENSTSRSEDRNADDESGSEGSEEQSATSEG